MCPFTYTTFLGVRIRKTLDTYIITLSDERMTQPQAGAPMFYGGTGVMSGMSMPGGPWVISDYVVCNMAIPSSFDNFIPNGAPLQHGIYLSEAPYFKNQYLRQNEFGTYHEGTYYYGHKVNGNLSIIAVDAKDTEN